MTKTYYIKNNFKLDYIINKNNNKIHKFYIQIKNSN